MDSVAFIYWEAALASPESLGVVADWPINFGTVPLEPLERAYGGLLSRLQRANSIPPAVLERLRIDFQRLRALEKTRRDQAVREALRRRAAIFQEQVARALAARTDGQSPAVDPLAPVRRPSPTLESILKTHSDNPGALARELSRFAVRSFVANPEQSQRAISIIIARLETEGGAEFLDALRELVNNHSRLFTNTHAREMDRIAQRTDRRPLRKSVGYLLGLLNY